MVTAAAFLILLDAVIVSATPNLTRLAFALVVSIVVGYAILSIWRSNSRIEKASSDPQKDKSGGSGRPAGGVRRFLTCVESFGTQSLVRHRLREILKIYKIALSIMPLRIPSAAALARQP